MSKILGLDLGSSSIGWTIRDENNQFTSGVITFDSGMIKDQNGGYTSPTKDRREARSSRRLLQARRYRKWALLEFLIKEDYVPLDRQELDNWRKYKKGFPKKFPESELFKKWLACDFTYEGNKRFKNPYDLRVHALDNEASRHEFGRALYHLVQRRGYKNIGESEFEELDIEEAKKNEETKKQLEKREKEGFAKAMEIHKGVIAKALKHEFLDKGKRARNQYPYRKEYREEFEMLCKAQGFDISRVESAIYNNPTVQQLWKAIIWQRSLRSQKGNIGRCTLEPDKPRCPVSHPLFEIFRAWQFINTIQTVDTNGSRKKESLSDEFRQKLFLDFFLKKDKNVKFEEIRTFLNKLFKHKKNYNYKDDHSASTMPVCKGLIEVFGDEAKKQILELERYIIGGTAKGDKRDKIAPKIIQGKYSVLDLWHALYSFDEAYLKTFARLKLKIAAQKNKKGRLYNPFVELKKNIASSFSDLSVKAISKIIPFLKEGHVYNEAVLLAKMPDLFGESWNEVMPLVLDAIQKSNSVYAWEKTISTITNNLINSWKGLPSNEKFAYKNTDYVLQADDEAEVMSACVKHFGENTWNAKSEAERSRTIQQVKDAYQDFFKDDKRSYRRTSTLNELLQNELLKQNVKINGRLYHHSKRENLYLKKIGTKEDGTPRLPVHKGTGKEILPMPIIDSIKNPMFNKALSILRKLLNEMIVSGMIDEETEIVIEVARDLNDNNKRIAIERYQRERENRRESYRKLLQELKNNMHSTLNIDENIPKVELWTEQIFSEEQKGLERLKRETILKEKDEVKRYELWTEQEGVCMYTGKMISLTQLFSNEIDIEHTVPRSLLPDNTLANKTVCFAWYNRDEAKKNQRIPSHCDNYLKEVSGWGSAIKDRLKHWEEIRAHYEELYEKNKKPKGAEDETAKNKRIQAKHYFKLHLDYWTDKIERFTCEEIKESWARRQLTDTQMISSYAREFLCTYFKKVKVQKADVNVSFRKIFSFQEEDELKNRNKHTHHAIDATVLTLIPTNSSYRDRLLKTMYEWQEQKRGQFTIEPFSGFNAQKLLRQIESTVLVVNYEQNNIVNQTAKKVRNRGRLAYVRDKQGKLIMDSNGNVILKVAKGDTVRSPLYKDTFVAKNKDVATENGKPLRNEDGTWQFKTGTEAFYYAKRIPIDKAKQSIDDIVDPIIKELVRKQKGNAVVKDYQGNEIRHIRVRTTAGKKVKERINYRSEKEYKNHYYAASGALPYAIFIQDVRDGEIERKLIPISSAEIAKVYKKYRKFEPNTCLQEFYPEYMAASEKRLLKVGQKVLVLTSDEEFVKVFDATFQTKRLYQITQFKYKGDKIMLQYHLESRSAKEIDKSVKQTKNGLLLSAEKELGIHEIKRDETIVSITERNKEFEKRLYAFDSRLKEIGKIDVGRADTLKRQIENYKTESSICNDSNSVPILGLTQKNWNFLFEGDDFDLDLTGKIKLRLEQALV